MVNGVAKMMALSRKWRVVGAENFLPVHLWFGAVCDSIKLG
ncbi:MAG: hypothetical protein U0Y96_04980 [Candidatus Kapaibacterium sp.]